MTKKKPTKYNRNIDWEPIEQDWAAGQLSRAAIARKHDVTRRAIDKHMDKAGIEYGSLASSIRLKVQAKLVEQPEEVASTVAGPLPEENVERAAEAGAAIIRFHRKDIARQFELKEKVEVLLEKVDIPEGTETTLVHVRDLKLYAEAVDTVTRTTERLIKLQRQAYSLDEQQENEGKTVAQAIAEAVKDGR